MEIWADGTDLEFVTNMRDLGILHGTTTNPNQIAACCYSLQEVIDHLLQKQGGPVAAQVVGEKAEDMKRQGMQLHAYAPRIIVKVPVTSEGVVAIQYLVERGVTVMATAIFAPFQALFAFKAGAHYLAPYLGRIADFGDNPMELLAYIQKVQANYKYSGKIIAAGIRTADQVIQCASMGISAVTFPRKIYTQLVQDHPGTLQAMSDFTKAWEKTKQSEALFK